MKYNEEFATEIFKWVEKNGVYPQKMGASVNKLCEQFGIDDETYRTWKETYPFFSGGIKKANEVFKVNTCNDIVNSLVQRARGYTDTQTEIVGKPDANGDIRSEKVRRVEKKVPPDVGAQIFLLTNLDSDNWANPMKIEAKTDITSGGRPLNIVVEKEETKELLEKVKEKLANQ